MKKRKILFTTPSFICGGVEKSLLSVLSIIPEEQFEATLLLTKKKGDLLPYVPKWITIMELPLAPMDRYELEHGRRRTLLYAISHFHWIHAIRMIALRLYWRLFARHKDYNLIIAKSIMSRVDKSFMESNFDFAFAYDGWYISSVAALEIGKASTSAIWCHDENKIGTIKSGLWGELHSRFTYRFATKQLCERLNSDAPSNWQRFEEMPYILDRSLMMRMADEDHGFDDGFTGLRILSVGRLCGQKGFDKAVDIAAKMKANGLSFRWYVIGGGEDRGKLERAIVEHGISDSLILLGQHINPYPFFKGCDIYAQPSRWEAYCITVAEARMFCKPIVCTDFVGATEQLVNGKTGFIVPVGDWNGFRSKLELLLTDSELRETLSHELSLTNPDTSLSAMAKWRSLLGF